MIQSDVTKIFQDCRAESGSSVNSGASRAMSTNAGYAVADPIPASSGYSDHSGGHTYGTTGVVGVGSQDPADIVPPGTLQLVKDG